MFQNSMTGSDSMASMNTSSQQEFKDNNNNTDCENTLKSILLTLVDVNVLLTTVYLAIFLIGVIGNICNCLVIADSKNKYMRTATNYYLFSLSVSDLLLLIFGLPHDIVNLWHPSPYMFNQFVCISRGWISEASTYASVLVIVAFTFERYLAICHPLKSHTLSRLSRSIKIIVIIWLVASTCALLVVMQYGIMTTVEKRPNGQEITNSQCTTVNRNERIFELSSLIFFIIPMAVITILYINLGYHLRKKTSIIRRQNKLKKQRQRSRKDQLEEEEQQQQQQQQTLESTHNDSSRISKLSTSENYNLNDQESSKLNESGQSKNEVFSNRIFNWLSNFSRGRRNGNKKSNIDDLNLSQMSYKFEESCCVPISGKFDNTGSVGYTVNCDDNPTGNNDITSCNLKANSALNSPLSQQQCNYNYNYDDNTPSWTPNNKLSRIAVKNDHEIELDINKIQVNIIDDGNEKRIFENGYNKIEVTPNSGDDKYISDENGALCLNELKSSSVNDEKMTNNDVFNVSIKNNDNYNNIEGQRRKSNIEDESELFNKTKTLTNSGSFVDFKQNIKSSQLQQQQYDYLNFMKPNLRSSSSNDKVESASAIERVIGEKGEDPSLQNKSDIKTKHSRSFISHKMYSHLTSNNYRNNGGRNSSIQNGPTRKQNDESNTSRICLSLKNQEPIALTSTANTGNLQSVIKMLSKFVFIIPISF